MTKPVIKKKDLIITVLVITVIIVLGLIAHRANESNKLDRRIERWLSTQMGAMGSGELLTEARMECVVKAMREHMTDKEIDHMLRNNLSPQDEIGAVRVEPLLQQTIDCYWAR